MKFILLAFAGCAAVCLVGCAGAVLLEAWWSDIVYAPDGDPELDEVLRNSSGDCWAGE